MRVLVTSTPGLGHVLPLLPVALELGRRGHQVHWVVGADSAETLTAAGIEVTVAGMPEVQRTAEFARRHPDLRALPPPERRAIAFSTFFGELAAPLMIEPVRRVVERWQPEVVVHDAAELAAPLVAAACGLPSVCQGFGEIVPELAVRRAGDVVAPLWDAAGLTPDPYAGSYRGLYVDIYPPGLGSLDMSHVPRVQLRRPAVGTPASGRLVYVTFGTLFNEIDPGFRAAVAAAAAVADEVLVTVGRDGKPEGLGELPANVSVERFVPQAEVLARCGAVVCHGGSGTVLAALAHGVPLLCLPRGADQFANGANVARIGAGRTILGDASADDLRAALDLLLNDDRHRAAAKEISTEIAAMPSDADVADAIEREVTPTG